MKKFFRQVQFAALALAAACGSANAGPVTILSSAEPDAFPIVALDGTTATFVVDAGDAEVVSTAAQAVSDDIKLITGKSIPVANTLAGTSLPIIAGTLGQSELIDALADAGKIASGEVAGKWEAYGLEVVDNPVDGVERALVAYGANPRGTAYALFEISRLMGVSPYVWWADVQPEERDALYATHGTTTVGEPSVKFRGIFINDEDWGLTPWAAKNIDAKYKNIGPNTYAKVMELLLRLRANVLWPAMHSCSQAFWDNKDNLPIAKKYDIALGSSHCEQMLRDNEWEWRRYDNNSGTNENWNYVTNKAKIQRYWEERVEESKGFSAMYTLGMRGVHDWGISGYPTTQDKVRGLTEIIDFQRSLLEKHIGDPTTVPQIFIPYKEVLDAYNAGLKVPEDVILTWVDDNHGYIRQLPTETEQLRSGGHGVYYHLSYWGTPADYLWICSTSPSLCSYELVKGYENGIRDLWVINVGDIKPAEAELEFCMDLAWDVDAWQPEKAHEYSRYWAAKTFGEDVADELGAIKLEYYRLGAGGKPEHVYGVTYNDKEMNDRIDSYASLVSRVEAVKAQIPARLQDAFFQLFEYPVKGAYYMNVKIFRAKQSLALAAAGQREAALSAAAEARKAYRMIDEITVKYNTGISGGKWNSMMDSKPRQQATFYMPETATMSSISQYELPVPEERFLTVAAADYTGSRGNIKELKGLGIGESSVAVWPMDYKNYAVRDAETAPYVEYNVPVTAGVNTIEVRFLPTFPIHSGGEMNVGVSVDGAKPVIASLKTVATEGKWNSTVMRGYNDATVTHVAETDGTVSVRVYLMNPGIAVSEVYNRLPMDTTDDLTSKLMVNPDFEYDSEGNLNAYGETKRGVPFGWTIEGKLNGNSYGINNDATNLHGHNVCWMNSTPMPAKFELSQTIKSDKLEPGYYMVRCQLWTEREKLTSCRLFANNNVQYYGSKSEYTNLLTPGEENTYAGYSGGRPDVMTLQEMMVCVYVGEGEDLKVGIRTGNKHNNGKTATDNAGWFKVDNFRIDRLGSEPSVSEEDLTLTEALITNYDFELYSVNGTVRENTSGETRRYTPYGWSLQGKFPGTSYGINKDVANPHGVNGCWYLPKEGVMPDDFELYQTIPAEKIEPGKYAVYCKLWVQDGYLGTTRLFANDNVQYYGMDIDYDKNLTPGENATFAGYVGGQDNVFVLQDMFVTVDIAEGEDLRLGIRSGNMLPDGSRGAERSGWFKTDFFRIHKLDGTGVENISIDRLNPDAPVYNLAGQRVADNAAGISALPAGIYISDGYKFHKK